jgi:carbon monoxide dehydrogenase subunit G
MKIEETFVLQAPSDEVFAFLSDVEQVASCVPGVEGLRQTDDGGWEAGLKAQLGPITAAFRGQVQLTTTPPGRLEAAGKGQDRASGSRVDAVADVTIRGRLGQFGTGVIRATATELIREFVTCADARLQVSATDPLATAARTAPPSTTTSQTPPWKLALRIIARTIRDSIRSLVERVRTARKG